MYEFDDIHIQGAGKGRYVKKKKKKKIEIAERWRFMITILRPCITLHFILSVQTDISF